MRACSYLMRRMAYRLSLRSALVMAAIIGLAACQSTERAVQLDFTPGPPVTITEDTYMTAAFSVRYPKDWRVITGAADAAPGGIFVAPDDRALLMLSTGPIDNPPELNALSSDQRVIERREIEISDSTVYAVLVAAPDEIEMLLPLFERVITSISG